MFVLLITKGIWFPQDYAKARIGGTAIIVIGSITTTFLCMYSNFFWNFILLIPWLKNFINNYLGISSPETPPFGIIVLFIAFSFSIILGIVYLLFKDNTSMQKHTDSFAKLIGEREFDSRLKSFCDHLTRHLNNLDAEANWSDAHFTHIEAEVEVITNDKKLRRITNFLSALRKDKKSKVFLVLGDPGAGKSVALRKLCRDLLKEVASTNKIPLYINLREWRVAQEWTEENPPTYEDFYNFVLANLKGRDVFADEFIDSYFKRLFENGHIFWILDPSLS